MGTVVQMPARSGGGRPSKTGYRLSDGTKVPSVTTITGRFKDSGALIRWAWKQGEAGIPLDKARDEAASAGALAHDMIEAKLCNTEGPRVVDIDAETLGRATNALGQFERWYAGSGILVTETEVPLVSEQHKFGGTFDAIGTLEDRAVLVDWKTSNGVYPEYIIQLGGYSILLKECRGIELHEAHLCRFDKDAETFAHHSWGRSVLDAAEKAFLHARALYECDKALKRYAR